MVRGQHSDACYSEEDNLHHLMFCFSHSKCWISQNIFQLHNLYRTVLASCLQISNWQPETWVYLWTVIYSLTNKSQDCCPITLPPADTDTLLCVFRVNPKAVTHLTLVQNVAARLLTNSESQERDSPSGLSSLVTSQSNCWIDVLLIITFAYYV